MSQETETDWAEWANWILAGILVFILGGYMYRFLNPTDSDALVGASAPTLSLESARGDGTIQLKDYRGEVVVLDFWATWCKPCERQMRSMKKAMSRSGIAKRATPVLVNTQDSGENRRERVQQYLDRRNIDFPAVLDDGSAMQKFPMRGLPTMFVIDGEGTVTYVGSGAHPADKIAEEIKKAAEG